MAACSLHFNLTNCFIALLHRLVDTSLESLHRRTGSVCAFAEGDAKWRAGPKRKSRALIQAGTAVMVSTQFRTEVGTKQRQSDTSETGLPNMPLQLHSNRFCYNRFVKRSRTHHSIGLSMENFALYISIHFFCCMLFV